MATKFLNGIDLAAQPAVNGSDPVNPQDLSTKHYVDTFVRGLNIRPAVRAAATGNVTLTGPGTSMDGVTLNVGDRVLLFNQTTPSQDGLWVFQGSAVALTRPNDYASASVQPEGIYVTITEGTTYGDKLYVTTTSSSVTVDTTANAWGPLGGGGATYTAGAGLVLTSGAFAVNVGAGIIADATSTRVDTSVVARKISMNVPGATTTPLLTHNLGTRDVQVVVRDTVTFAEVKPDNVATDLNNVTLTFGTAPAAGAYRATIIG